MSAIRCDRVAYFDRVIVRVDAISPCDTANIIRPMIQGEEAFASLGEGP